MAGLNIGRVNALLESVKGELTEREGTPPGFYEAMEAVEKGMEAPTKAIQDAVGEIEKLADKMVKLISHSNSANGMKKAAHELRAAVEKFAKTRKDTVVFMDHYAADWDD